MLENIIGALIISVVNLLLWCKLLKKQIDYKNYKVYIGIIAMSIIIILNFFLLNTILKILTVLIIYMVISLYIFDISIEEAITLSIFSHLLYIISEILAVMIILLSTNIQNKMELANIFSGTLHANLLISFIVILLMKIPFLSSLYERGIILLKNQLIFKTVIFVFVLFGCVSVILNFIYFYNNLFLLTISCLVLMVTFIYFVIKNITMRTNYLNMYVKYNSTSAALKSYEEILDKYKVSNHENKNQLLVIRNMLAKEPDIKVKKYIDKLIETDYKDDENLMMETSKIPAGGLRALIYSKLLYMKNNKINFILKVDRKIRGIQLIDLDESVNLDICKIIGVFLDNAIDEVNKNKTGSISVELYLINNKLNISIANTFEGVIELEKMSEKRYSTKGKNRGYGLTLVKEIIEKNCKFKNIRKINDNVFVQTLEIDV